MTDTFFKEASEWLVNVGSQADGSEYGEKMCDLINQCLNDTQSYEQVIEQLRKENERLCRENEVYAERHKAWESCVYMVGLPMMKAVRDTEYGDAVPPIPVVNKITDLLDECFKLRKERDELAKTVLEAKDRFMFASDKIMFSTEFAGQINLAKKVSEQNEV